MKGVNALGCGFWITVLDGSWDRCLGAPRPVEVLGLEDGDVGVAQRHVHEREDTGGVGDVVIASG